MPGLGKPGSIYNSSSWKRGAFRKAVLAQTGGRCAKCGQLGKQFGGPVTISIAHKIPERVRLALRRPLLPSDCLPMCLKCHGQEDGGRRYK